MSQEYTENETHHQYDDQQHNAGNSNTDDNGEDVQGKIFIGGLSWSTTEQTLRYYFEKYGELTDVALMIDKKTGKPRGFGFIKLKDPAAADVIMSNDHTIDGRLVDVKRALPRDKAPGPARSEACKIFVGGLSMDVTEREFGDYFNKFGAVKDAVVMVDRNTGSSRGFGFVTFEKEETVEKVMKIDHELHGKYVEIKRAEPREMGGGGRFGGGYGGYDHGGYGGGRGGGRGGRGGRGGGPDMYGAPYGGYMGMGGRFPGYGYPPRGGYPMPYYPPMGPGYGAPGYPAPGGAGGYASYGAAANPGAAGAGGPAAGGPSPYGGAAPNYPRGGAEFSTYDTKSGAPPATTAGGDPNAGAPAGYPRPAYGYGGAMPYGYGYPMPGGGVPPQGAGGKPPGGNEEGAAGYGAYRGAAGSQRADRQYRPY